MMNGKRENEKSDKDEVDRILESLWNNLESRRKCEKTHIPNYIKRELDSDQ